MTIISSFNLIRLSSRTAIRFSVIGKSSPSSFASRNMSTASPPINVQNLVVLGSGLMGAGIAQVSALSGKFNSVVLQDVDERALEKAKKTIGTSLERIQKKNPNVDPASVLKRITFSTSSDEKGIDEGLLIIEAVPEKLELKQNIFRELYSRHGKNSKVILATNTSSLPCRDIGVHIADKANFAGLHFFNPVAVMKLVEIVRVDDGTSDSVYKALVQFVRDIGKVGVTCRDTPGFIVNRLLIPYMFSAVEMAERGDATVQDIDVAMKLGAGYPMGPFELQDYTGLDTGLFISQGFKERDGTRIIKESKLVHRLVSEGKLGRKSGVGFYDYSTNPPTPTLATDSKSKI